ncbi:MAG: ATP-binding protein [Treponema sp.]|jgi:hypothetical protein|nr:ATP-binding protein [Treponema sp.]
MTEDEKTEFKREFTPDIKKGVVAFANTQSGKPCSMLLSTVIIHSAAAL